MKMKSRIYKIVCVMLMVSTMSCGSRVDVPTGTTSVPVEKVKTCEVNFQKTCWTETVQEIMKCAENKSEKFQFSPDMDHCSGPDGEFVEFKNTAQMFKQPFDGLTNYFSFSFAPQVSQSDCLNINGSANEFKIEVLGYSNPVEVIKNSSQFSFSCLDGQKIEVSREKLSDCESLNGKSSIPGVDFKVNTTAKGESISFAITGSVDTAEIFNCKL